MSCLVPFCRKDCPVLPDSANVLRAEGRCLCSVCGKSLDSHPTYSYPTGMKHVVLSCDNIFYHL